MDLSCSLIARVSVLGDMNGFVLPPVLSSPAIMLRLILESLLADRNCKFGLPLSDFNRKFLELGELKRRIESFLLRPLTAV